MTLWGDTEGDLEEHPAESKGLDGRVWEMKWGLLSCTKPLKEMSR